MPDSRVLLLGNAGSDSLAKALAGGRRTLTRTSDADEVVAVAADHDVIVLDAVAPPRSLADCCREIRAVPSLAELPILAISAADNVEDRIRLLEAGADDVVARPVDDRELDARLEALELRHRRSQELNPGVVVMPTRRAGRRLVVVYSPKGGVGTTTVAVNLALVLAARQPDQVALLDLGGEIGQVATHLDVQPRMTLADLARDDHSLGDPGTFTTYLTRHSSGLRILAAPGTGAAPTLDRDAITRLLDTALSASPTVVVDAGSRLGEATEAVIALADDLVVVVSPEFAALKAVRAVFDHLAATGLATAEPRIVLNELFAHEMLTPTDIEAALGRPVTVRIPHDPMQYQRAVNEGRPLLLLAPRSSQAQRFQLLARVLLGEDVPHEATGSSPRRRLGLFGRA
ncbi:MAG TPA: response regulator [Candidatus Limnocylindrales bacterium]|nr:response regulator [Candidatus Limnocylindrales bacterium]